MSSSAIREILGEIEGLLASAGDLPPEAELAVEKLLNVVEALSSDRQSLVDEVQRLKQQLDQKKKSKTTPPGDNPKQNTDHSSEKHRRKRQQSKPRSSSRSPLVQRPHNPRNDQVSRRSERSSARRCASRR